MWNSFVGGAIAGYAIAIPVGVIAILILETGLKRGFWHGFAAGSGAATADLIYATIAVTLGVAVAQLLDPIAPALKLASAAFLVAMGAAGLYRTWRARNESRNVGVRAVNANVYQTYVTLLALTILNPATIAYFAALILGGTVGQAPGTVEKMAFVAGAALASWSWQSLLAAIGALAHRHMPPGFRVWTSFVGNFIIIALGITILL
ncbi:MAG: LysE family transporter [Anaerolineae bacterium]|nr:LysE family transporter [Anaerolineae bacterium]